MKIILLTGGPGSGKSTQGQGLMNKNPAFQHLSLGELVRTKLQDPTHPITKQYQELISKGELLPDSCIFALLEEEIEKIKDKDIILLLDGYPRTEEQYEQFKKKWGRPAALIHLDVEEEVLRQRLEGRRQDRTDDNEQAINKRLDFYHSTTKPVIEKIKAELAKNAITLRNHYEINLSNLYLYTKLQRIPVLHEILKTNSPPVPECPKNTKIKMLSTFSVLSQLWQTGTDEYAAIASLQEQHHAQNLAFSFLGNRVTYLETPEEVSAVLKAKSNLGQVYRQFSLAAGLKHDFVASDVKEANSYRLADKSINIWKLIHTALNQSLKEDKKRIEHLIDKYLKTIFLAEKTFDLDKTFDNFFTGFWSEYLFGSHVSLESYQNNRHLILRAMRECFYSNKYKAIDPTGLSSLFYSRSVKEQLTAAKVELNGFITEATPDSLVQRFKQALETINTTEKLGLDEHTLAEIIADNVFDFIFEPDFLENVVYESLVSAVKENADLHEFADRRKIYNEGMRQGYLYPIRSRVLLESVALADGTIVPAGSMVYLNMKKSGLYHSAGPRQCVGQAYTHYFKEHLFNRLASIEFKIKAISHPLDRYSDDKNVPLSPERYQLSWRLKRDEAMRHLTSHDYKGQKFFDVLSLYKNPALNMQIVKQLILKINRSLEKKNINLDNVVIVTSEVRGIPVASQVAEHLQVPLFIIRKKGGYKMTADDVVTESYSKGYGDIDEVELPKEHVEAMAGKEAIFLDDGIASGKSALACINLIEKNCSSETNPAHVCMVMALLKHDYVSMEPKLSQHRLVKTLFDCKTMPLDPKVAELIPTFS